MWPCGGSPGGARRFAAPPGAPPARETAEGPAGPGAPAPARGGAETPGVQPALGPIELTLGTDSFEAGLSARRPPHAFLGPLGHSVSAAAPSGIVSGLATTVSRTVRE